MSVIQAHKERVGRQIRKARKQSGYSHDRLAQIVGSSRQHLIKLEKGTHLPRPELLSAIAKATGKPEAFFESDDDEEAEPVSLDDYLRARVRELFHEEIQAARREAVS